MIIAQYLAYYLPVTGYEVEYFAAKTIDEPHQGNTPMEQMQQPYFETIGHERKYNGR